MNASSLPELHYKKTVTTVIEEFINLEDGVAISNTSKVTNWKLEAQHPGVAGTPEGSGTASTSKIAVEEVAQFEKKLSNMQRNIPTIVTGRGRQTLGNGPIDTL
ncbi:hypothetical protein BC829DRAFT_490579 [Chytridium lagenaria]|nr:hypothetical protein BC829DRAFT_490579 [Chytridium lagenaria]